MIKKLDWFAVIVLNALQKSGASKNHLNHIADQLQEHDTLDVLKFICLILDKESKEKICNALGITSQDIQKIKNDLARKQACDFSIVLDGQDCKATLEKRIELKHCDAATWLQHQYGINNDINNLHQIIQTWDICELLSLSNAHALLTDDALQEPGRYRPFMLLSYLSDLKRSKLH